MKFWKKSSGDCGTMDDDGFVPDSVEITKDEYEEWLANIVILPEQIEKQRKAAIAAEVSKKYTLADEVVMLWKLQTGELTVDSPEIVEHRQTVTDAKSKYPKK